MDPKGRGLDRRLSASRTGYGARLPQKLLKSNWNIYVYPEGMYEASDMKTLGEYSKKGDIEGVDLPVIRLDTGPGSREGLSNIYRHELGHMALDPEGKIDESIPEEFIKGEINAEGFLNKLSWDFLYSLTKRVVENFNINFFDAWELVSNEAYRQGESGKDLRELDKLLRRHVRLSKEGKSRLEIGTPSKRKYWKRR